MAIWLGSRESRVLPNVSYLSGMTSFHDSRLHKSSSRPRGLQCLFLLISLLVVGCPGEEPIANDDDSSPAGDDDDSSQVGDDDDSSEEDCDDACPEGQACNEADQCVDVFSCPPEDFGPITTDAGPGDVFITWLPTKEVGNVAVKVRLPVMPRYIDRAGVVVNAATFFTTTGPFYTDLEATELGLIHISYVWPGSEEPSSGACSEGIFDHGGPVSIAVLRDVIRYALGDYTDIEGRSLGDRMDTNQMTADPDNVGIWAFSHPGIGAINALARYPAELADVAWFVGRENPTQDQHASVELGHFAENGERVLNPLYVYPDGYSSGELAMDMSGAGWNPDFIEAGHEDEPGRAFFDLDGDGFDTDVDHVLSFRIPTMYGKRYLSRPLTAALRANGLSEANWPKDLATPEEAEAAWSYRNSVDRYPDLAGRSLRAMLVYGSRQHVQPLPDATSVHSAWDGLRGAGLWVRINPDQAYATWASDGQNLFTSDGDANEAPPDWATAGADWGHSGLTQTGAVGGGKAAGLAAVAEMADRTEFDRWDLNLTNVLVPGFPPPAF